MQCLICFFSYIIVIMNEWIYKYLKDYGNITTTNNSSLDLIIKKMKNFFI